MSNQLEKIEYAVKRLNMSAARVYELIREGILPAVRCGRQVRIDPDALEAFINNGGKSLPGGWRKDGQGMEA
jgi:excisionase family DNA binding protein